MTQTMKVFIPKIQREVTKDNLNHLFVNSNIGQVLDADFHSSVKNHLYNNYCFITLMLFDSPKAIAFKKSLEMNGKTKIEKLV